MTVVVVIPSRGRPERARAAVEAIRHTAALVSTSVILAVDRDDPRWADYAALAFADYGPEVALVSLGPDETGDLVRATNTVSMRVARNDPDAIIGNLGDDHLAMTPGWDRLIEAALAEPGIAYGDDRLQGPRVPTAPFISARIVLALGWYALPSCRHLYIDDAWKALGLALGRLRYVPEVVISHEHPATGRVAWDDGYERANNAAAVEADHAAFDRWRNTTFHDDVTNVRRALRRSP